MELDQLVFTILRKSVHCTREPVLLRHEQVDFYPQEQDVSLRVLVVLAKQICESIRVMYCVFELLLSFDGLL